MRTDTQLTTIGPRTLPALALASVAWFLLLVVATYPAEAALVAGAVVALAATGGVLGRAAARALTRVKRRTLCIPRTGVCIEIRTGNADI